MLFIMFFLYIFPLFFSYVGIWMSNPLLSTVSLGFGIIGWILFNVLIFKSLIIDLKKIANKHEAILNYGKHRTANILNKYTKFTNKDGTKSLEIEIEFENLAGTMVRHQTQLEDTKPHENRFEVGKKLDLKLNPDGRIPPFVMGGSTTLHKKSYAYLWILFNTIYAVVVFLVSYKFLSRGFGWRFLSPWFPWVLIPYFGIFLTRFFGIVGNGSYLSKKFSGNRTPEENSRLLLYGKKSIANIIRADQTGMYINDQPEIQFRLNFLDDKNQLQEKSLKKIVLLTDLYKTQLGEREILYLPEDSDVFELL